ncbi:MAG: FHA domain-containing protein, partial [Bdellovibrionota bacterium]
MDGKNRNSRSLPMFEAVEEYQNLCHNPREMDLIFEIMEGELRGDRTPVREGLTIGRGGCDLNLRDSKVSAKHAKVERRADGALWLVDLGSSNAIKTEKGKVLELRLEPGLVFNIGRV